MKIIKSILLSTLLLLSVPTAFALDLEGKYVCEGYDPFAGSSYTNYFSIKKTGDAFFFQWVDRKDYPTAYGTGVLNKNSKNNIAVVYMNLGNKQKGLLLYTINQDGSLSGKWTVQADDKMGTEICKKRKP